ncbi:MAG: hypothetical protein J3K34DRAFT_432579 [Monoraphidium minutum]|nr:MAG: hypothetical protein J3K34DRAFT_432579 [Monoraphidium minutum]
MPAPESLITTACCPSVYSRSSAVASRSDPSSSATSARSAAAPAVSALASATNCTIVSRVVASPPTPLAARIAQRAPGGVGRACRQGAPRVGTALLLDARSSGAARSGQDEARPPTDTKIGLVMCNAHTITNREHRHGCDLVTKHCFGFPGDNGAH